MADPMMTGGEGLHATGKALHEEPIAAPAVKSGEEVITGPNHAAIEAQAGLKAPQEGFVKSDGAFVPRKEAAALAEAAGEAKPETTGKGLHSEDLPPQNKPPVVQDQTLPKWAGETVMGQPAPRGLSAQANVIPDAPSTDAKALLRQRIGLGARDTSRSITSLEPYEKRLNTMSPEDTRGFWSYVENRSKENAPPRPSDPHIADAADAWRVAAKERERKMGNFNDTEKMSFREDYGPHMYAETKPSGTGGTGLGAFFTKKGELPTFEAAEAAGFTPRYPPAEMMGRYLAIADKHIALKEAREIAKETGAIKRSMRGKQPEGWVELKNTGDLMGQSLYAPPDWAQAYNRTVDYVPHGGLWGGVKAVANASQALSFTLNARHFLTVGVEALGSEVARAAAHTAAGKGRTALGAALKSAYAVGHYGFKGNKGLRLYNGLISGSKEDEEIVSLLSQVNAHSGHKASYMSATKQGGFAKSYKAGSIPAEFKAYRDKIAAKETLLGKGSRDRQDGADARWPRHGRHPGAAVWRRHPACEIRGVDGGAWRLAAPPS